jgi:hypothetical protein
VPSRQANADRALWRRFLLCAVSVALVGGCGSKAGVSDPLKLVPSDSRLLLQVNVSRLRQTQFKDRLLQLRDRNEGLKKKWDNLVQKSGFDPMRDLDTVLLALPYGGEKSAGEGAAVLIGRFNQPALVAWFKEQAGTGFKESKHGNRTIYSMGNDPHLSFISSTTAVAGDLVLVKKILDLADGKGQSARQTPTLVELTSRVPGNQVAWGVVSVPDEVRKRAQESDSPFKAVANIVVSLDFAAGLALDFRAECSDENEAQALTDKFNNLVKELLESPMFGSLGLGAIVSALKGAKEGKTFRVRGNLPQQQLDDLLKKVEEAFKSRLGSSGMPRIKLPTQEEGGPKLDDSAPASNKAADDKGTEGKSDETKAAPGDEGLPSLKLNMPGGTKGKRRPSLLGQ